MLKFVEKQPLYTHCFKCMLIHSNVEKGEIVFLRYFCLPGSSSKLSFYVYKKSFGIIYDRYTFIHVLHRSPACTTHLYLKRNYILGNPSQWTRNCLKKNSIKQDQNAIRVHCIDPFDMCALCFQCLFSSIISILLNILQKAERWKTRYSEMCVYVKVVYILKRLNFRLNENNRWKTTAFGCYRVVLFALMRETTTSLHLIAFSTLFRPI